MADNIDNDLSLGNDFVTVVEWVAVVVGNLYWNLAYIGDDVFLNDSCDECCDGVNEVYADEADNIVLVVAVAAAAADGIDGDDKYGEDEKDVDNNEPVGNPRPMAPVSVAVAFDAELIWLFLYLKTAEELWLDLVTGTASVQLLSKRQHSRPS